MFTKWFLDLAHPINHCRQLKHCRLLAAHMMRLSNVLVSLCACEEADKRTRAIKSAVTSRARKIICHYKLSKEIQEHCSRPSLCLSATDSSWMQGPCCLEATFLLTTLRQEHNRYLPLYSIFCVCISRLHASILVVWVMKWMWNKPILLCLLS